jgi:uncharacterized protein YciI
VPAGAAADPHHRDQHRHHLGKDQDEFELLTIGTFTGPTGTFRQRAELSKVQRDILAKLDFPHPTKIVEATPVASA